MDGTSVPSTAGTMATTARAQPAHLEQEDQCHVLIQSRTSSPMQLKNPKIIK